MIIRVHKQERFTTIDNAFLNNEKLSWKAKGLFAYMLSKPNDWKFNEKHLQKLSKDGKKSLSTTLHELQDNGYLERHAKRDDKGRMVGYEYDLYENQQMAKEGIKQVHEAELSITHFSGNGESGNGKTDNGESAPTKDLKILNTDIINKPTAFNTFRDELNNLLKRNNVDTRAYVWSVYTKIMKELSKDFTEKELISCLPAFESDDYAKKGSYSFNLFRYGLPKYLKKEQTIEKEYITIEDLEKQRGLK